MNKNIQEIAEKHWNEHFGPAIAISAEYTVIDCVKCGFKHIIAIPSQEELEEIYTHEYYTKEKPDYIEKYIEDLKWWNNIYTSRYEIFEKFLPIYQRKILDIGSGPGYFLLNGKERGWKVKGVEPSIKAALYSQGLDLEIENIYFNEKTAPMLGKFDVINMGEVLEHIPDPNALLQLAHSNLNVNGLICIIVPNDFNPFQLILRDQLGFKPWWVSPPHHINYFDHKSLAKLLVKAGFSVLHQESTFPIDLFLLMGDNYIGNYEVGRECHTRRMNFENAILQNNNNLFDIKKLYSLFSEMGIGREIFMIGRKNL